MKDQYESFIAYFVMKYIFAQNHLQLWLIKGSLVLDAFNTLSNLVKNWEFYKLNLNTTFYSEFIFTYFFSFRNHFIRIFQKLHTLKVWI